MKITYHQFCDYCGSCSHPKCEYRHQQFPLPDVHALRALRRSHRFIGEVLREKAMNKAVAA